MLISQVSVTFVINVCNTVSFLVSIGEWYSDKMPPGKNATPEMKSLLLAFISQIDLHLKFCVFLCLPLG